MDLWHTIMFLQSIQQYIEFMLFLSYSRMCFIWGVKGNKLWFVLKVQARKLSHTNLVLPRSLTFCPRSSSKLSYVQCITFKLLRKLWYCCLWWISFVRNDRYKRFKNYAFGGLYKPVRCWIMFSIKTFIFLYPPDSLWYLISITLTMSSDIRFHVNGKEHIGKYFPLLSRLNSIWQQRILHLSDRSPAFLLIKCWFNL